MKYVLGSLGAILLLFVAAILVFNRGGGTTSPQDNVAKTAQLIDYADKSSQVSLTTYGDVVGDNERRAIRVTITPSERRVEVLEGYNESVTSSQSFLNNRAAYENFLSAIGGQGFLTSKKTDIKDQRSVCPTGNRYVYELSEAGNSVSQLWGVSCNKTGTFNGRSSSVRQLFQAQIPEYNTQVRGVKL